MTVSANTFGSVPGLIGNASNLLQISGAALSLGSAALAYFRPSTSPRGINGFLFDIPLSDQVKLTAQITDHYVEGNYAIHDHIALEPVRITLTGVLCELVYAQSPLERLINQALDRLQPIQFVSPELAINPTQTALVRQTLAEANRLKSAVQKTADIAEDLYSWVTKGTPAETRQQEGFRFLKQLFDTREVGTVETPWATFTDMVIESVTFDQDEMTRDLTTVTAQFKQIRKADATIGVKLELGKAAQSAAAVAEKGTNSGPESSWLKTALDSLKGL